MSDDNMGDVQTEHPREGRRHRHHEHAPERASSSGGAYSKLTGLPGAAKSRAARGCRVNTPMPSRHSPSLARDPIDADRASTDRTPSPGLPGRSATPSPGLPKKKKKKKTPLHNSRFSHGSTSPSEAEGNFGGQPTDTCGTPSHRWALGYSACPSKDDSR